MKGRMHSVCKNLDLILIAGFTCIINKINIDLHLHSEGQKKCNIFMTSVCATNSSASY